MSACDTVSGGARAVARCQLLGAASFSETADGLFRPWLSPAFGATQRQVAEWMVGAGMSVVTDPATNLVGRYGEHADQPTLILGSHIDSVRNGGVYDGALGVMLGIEVVSILAAERRRLPFAVEVVAFGDEEGSRFPAAMLTSRAVAGTLTGPIDIADAAGVTLADALVPFGTSPAGLQRARRSSALAYLEAHIEQGPVLEAEGLALGVVTGIAAQLRFRITLAGKAGHAGTTTMALRRDALAAAAEIVLAVERIGASRGADLVATVGWLRVEPGAANVIAGDAELTLDIRSLDASIRDHAAAEIIAEGQAIAARRGIGFGVEQVHDLPASPCDPALTSMLVDTIVAQGGTGRTLVSGAGHDAMVMSALCPTAMIFIRCRGGLSHHPDEHVEIPDVQAALDAMLGFIDRLERTHGA